MEASSAPDHTAFNNELMSLNTAIALERVGGDPELLQEVARLFLDECPQVLSSIRAAVESRDPKALESAAHSLKGAVSNFGAEATVHAAQQLEQLGRTGQLDAATGALHSLEAALEQLTPELTALADGSAT